MRTETAVSILEYFPGSKWANPDSAKHAEAAKVLEAVAHCRKHGTIGGDPLPANREEWSPYAIGMVYVALERMEANR